MQPTQPPTRGGGSRPSSHPGAEPRPGDWGGSPAPADGKQESNPPEACLTNLVAPEVGRSDDVLGRERGGANDLSEFTGSARQAGRDVAEAARGQAGEVASQIKAGAQQATQQVKQTAFDAARAIREHGQQLFGQQKDRAAEELAKVSAAVRKAGDKLDQENDPNLAHYVHGLAEQVGRASNYLKGQDFGRLIADAQRFGRQRPEWLLGGMFVAGMALARFLKASSTSGSSQRLSGNESGSSANRRSDFPAPAAEGRASYRPSDDRHSAHVSPQVGPGVSRDVLTEPGMYSGSYVDARTGLPYDRSTYGSFAARPAEDAGAASSGTAFENDLSIPQAPTDLNVIPAVPSASGVTAEAPAVRQQPPPLPADALINTANGPADLRNPGGQQDRR